MSTIENSELTMLHGQLAYPRTKEFTVRCEQHVCRSARINSKGFTVLGCRLEIPEVQQMDKDSDRQRLLLFFSSQ
jgi:hypothetical protein